MALTKNEIQCIEKAFAHNLKLTDTETRILDTAALHSPVETLRYLAEHNTFLDFRRLGKMVTTLIEHIHFDAVDSLSTSLLNSTDSNQIYFGALLNRMYTGETDKFIENVNKAIKSGSPVAHYQLYNSYSNGSDGLESNEALAKSNLTLAAKKGYALAQYDMGRKYSESAAENFYWFFNAAFNGSNPALAELAEIIEHNIKNENDWSIAYKLYYVASHRGSETARVHLNNLWKNTNAIINISEEGYNSLFKYKNNHPKNSNWEDYSEGVVNVSEHWTQSHFSFAIRTLLQISLSWFKDLADTSPEIGPQIENFNKDGVMREFFPTKGRKPKTQMLSEKNFFSKPPRKKSIVTLLKEEIKSSKLEVKRLKFENDSLKKTVELKKFKDTGKENIINSQLRRISLG